jgi:hypothetical protein
MGIHFANGGLIGDGLLDAERPELLIYEQKAGRLRLVGVEFLVIAADWHAHTAAPPVLMGQHFHYVGSPNRYGLPPFYELHVWAWGTTRTACSSTGIQRCRVRNSRQTARYPQSRATITLRDRAWRSRSLCWTIGFRRGAQPAPSENPPPCRNDTATEVGRGVHTVKRLPTRVRRSSGQGPTSPPRKSAEP